MVGGLTNYFETTSTFSQATSCVAAKDLTRASVSASVAAYGELHALEGTQWKAFSCGL